jgi:hypothetical protein
MTQARSELRLMKIAAILALSIGLPGCHTCQFATGDNLHEFAGCADDAIRVFGFQPLQPPFTIENRFASVWSLTPTLKWQPSTLMAGDHTISSMRYDLAIWKAINPYHADSDSFSDARFSRGNVWVSVDALEIAYERQDLTETSHTVETALEPGTEYAWSVRARFDLNGETRVSEWSLVMMPEPLSYVTHGGRAYSSREHARLTGQIPSYALYYFITPRS